MIAQEIAQLTRRGEPSRVSGRISRRNGDLDNGYESPRAFQSIFTQLFNASGPFLRGLTPLGSPDIVVSWIDSPLGPLVTGATADGLCLLEFSDREILSEQLATVGKLFNASIVPGSNEHLELLHRELEAYFAGSLRNFTAPLVYPGTEFQRRVWHELCNIPYGETCSYQDVAVAIGEPLAARAVGRANGLNRIAIVIPCHRVVNTGGKLGGYGGGLRRKQYLLDLERSHA